MQQRRHVYTVHGDLIRWDLYTVHGDLNAVTYTLFKIMSIALNAVTYTLFKMMSTALNAVINGGTYMLFKQVNGDT